MNQIHPIDARKKMSDCLAGISSIGIALLTIAYWGAFFMVAGCYNGQRMEDAAHEAPALVQTLDSSFVEYKPQLAAAYRNAANKAPEFKNWKEFDKALDALEDARLSAFDPFNVELTKRFYGVDDQGQPNKKAKYADRVTEVQAACNEIADHLDGGVPKPAEKK